MPVTLRGGPSASRDGVISVLADFDAVDEMNADGDARKGKQVDTGLAIGNSWISRGWQSLKFAGNIPRRAIEVANLVLESMMNMGNGRWASGEKMEKVLRCGANQLFES